LFGKWSDVTLAGMEADQEADSFVKYSFEKEDTKAKEEIFLRKI
jgi:hypothetical protein